MREGKLRGVGDKSIPNSLLLLPCRPIRSGDNRTAQQQIKKMEEVKFHPLHLIPLSLATTSLSHRPSSYHIPFSHNSLCYYLSLPRRPSSPSFIASLSPHHPFSNHLIAFAWPSFHRRFLIALSRNRIFLIALSSLSIPFLAAILSYSHEASPFLLTPMSPLPSLPPFNEPSFPPFAAQISLIGRMFSKWKIIMSR